MKQAKGSFEVKLEVQPLHASSGTGSLGRQSITKTYTGALVATACGEMLAAMGSVKGSAGYVALEFVTGTLDGRKGSFALQHFGVMNRGAPSLQVQVVPDSGTDELTGLSGTLTINIENGRHDYDFRYELP